MIVNCTPLTLFLRLPEIGIFKSCFSCNGGKTGWPWTYLYDRLLGVTARVIRLDPLIKAKPNKASESYLYVSIDSTSEKGCLL